MLLLRHNYWNLPPIMVQQLLRYYTCKEVVNTLFLFGKVLHLLLCNHTFYPHQFQILSWDAPTFKMQISYQVQPKPQLSSIIKVDDLMVPRKWTNYMHGIFTRSSPSLTQHQQVNKNCCLSSLEQVISEK
jgi:hypothetical protein